VYQQWHVFMTRSLATSLFGIFGILAIAGGAFGRPFKWSDGTQRLAVHSDAARSDPTTGGEQWVSGPSRGYVMLNRAVKASTTDNAKLAPRWRWVLSYCVHDSGSFGRQVDGKHKMRGPHENSWSGILAQEEGTNIIRTDDVESLARLSPNGSITVHSPNKHILLQGH